MAAPRSAGNRRHATPPLSAPPVGSEEKKKSGSHRKLTRSVTSEVASSTLPPSLLTGGSSPAARPLLAPTHQHATSYIRAPSDGSHLISSHSNPLVDFSTSVPPTFTHFPSPSPIALPGPFQLSHPHPFPSLSPLTSLSFFSICVFLYI